jgi:hypothetical protein
MWFIKGTNGQKQKLEEAKTQECQRQLSLSSSNQADLIIERGQLKAGWAPRIEGNYATIMPQIN